MSAITTAVATGIWTVDRAHSSVEFQVKETGIAAVWGSFGTFAGQLEIGEEGTVLCCLGVALHETFHAKHTKRWVAEHDAELAKTDPQLATDRRLLEEPRMEAHGVRDHPLESVRGRFISRALGAAVTDALPSPSPVPRLGRSSTCCTRTGSSAWRCSHRRASAASQSPAGSAPGVRRSHAVKA
jgi:hypothetical protein